MEKDKNKNLIIGILIGVIIMLVLVIIIGLIIYKKFYLKEYIVDNNTNQVTEKQEDIKEAKSEESEKIVLNEEDVKKWLSNNNGIIELYFILEGNDFDYNTATKERYGGFLGLSLMFGGLTNNAIESINLGYDGEYNYQHSYTIDFIKNILKPLGVGLESIDINQMNNSFNGFANFSMDNNKFTIKVIATGLDNYHSLELNKISLNDNNEIIVNYILKDCLEFGGECQFIGHRELVLKKIDDGYNLLKAYKVD